VAGCVWRASDIRNDGRAKYIRRDAAAATKCGGRHRRRYHETPGVLSRRSEAAEIKGVKAAAKRPRRTRRKADENQVVNVSVGGGKKRACCVGMLAHGHAASSNATSALAAHDAHAPGSYSCCVISVSGGITRVSRAARSRTPRALAPPCGMNGRRHLAHLDSNNKHILWA